MNPTGFGAGLLSRAAWIAVTGLALLAPAGEAAADWKPERPIRVIVPFGAGGTSDVLGRVMLKKMEEQTGWTVIVENKTGAAGALGAIEVMKAKPDGYTIGLSATTIFSLLPYTDPQVGFKPGDLDYIATVGLIEFAIVAKADAPYNNMKELGEYSKTKPVRFVSQGRPLELSMEQMAKTFGINYVTSNTSGSAESLQLVAGGHADIAMDGGLHVSFIKDGRLKALTVLSDQRAGYAPDTPAIGEQGGTIPIRNYTLFLAPKGMPADVRAALAKALDDALNTKEMKDHLATIFMQPKNLGPDGSTQDVLDQAKQWEAYFAAKK